MEVNLVNEAIKFMALGMGIVFSFLIIMILALKLQAFLIEKFLTKNEAEKTTTSNSTNLQQNSTDDKQITAAITAAIIHHNNITKG